MTGNTFKWIAAIFVSLGIHAAVANLFEEPQEDVQIAGGSSLEVAMLGNAFADTISSGDMSHNLETLKPVEHENTIPAETRPELLPDQPDETQTLSPVQTSKLAVLEPQQDMPVLSDLPVLQKNPVPAKRKTIEPLPDKKASEEAKNKEPQPKKKPKKLTRKKKKSAIRKTARGNKGKSGSDTKKGVADGQKKGKSKSSSKASRVAIASGNAEVSNYPGKIVRKLRRSLRYPKAARRKRTRGQVIVSFVVLKSGQASGLRIVRGSGSSILDKAALDTIRRAAPFPTIPPQAKRSKWAFKVPLAFR